MNEPGRTRGIARATVYVASLALHVGVGWALAATEVKKAPEVEIVRLQTVVVPPKPKPPPPPEPEEPAPPPPKAAPVARKAPAAAPPTNAPPPPPGPAAPVDLGFAVGLSSGPGGMAIASPTAAPVERKTTRTLSAPKPADDTCTDAEVKAKATAMPRPTYTEEARAANIEGKVRVELTVDPSGAVTGARVLEGLGHGLDEAAMEAVRGASFAPATRCGKPVASTFTVAVRFTL